MKKIAASIKLELAVRALQTGKPTPLRTMCRNRKVARQSADNWADELMAAAGIVFGPEKAPARIRKLEERNRQLRDRVDLLSRTLSRHGIDIPPLRADDLDEEDIGLIAGDDKSDVIPDPPPKGPIRPAW